MPLKSSKNLSEVRSYAGTHLSRDENIWVRNCLGHKCPIRKCSRTTKILVQFRFWNVWLGGGSFMMNPLNQSFIIVIKDIFLIEVTIRPRNGSFEFRRCSIEHTWKRQAFWVSVSSCGTHLSSCFILRWCDIVDISPRFPKCGFSGKKCRNVWWYVDPSLAMLCYCWYQFEMHQEKIWTHAKKRKKKRKETHLFFLLLQDEEMF